MVVAWAWLERFVIVVTSLHWRFRRPPGEFIIDAVGYLTFVGRLASSCSRVSLPPLFAADLDFRNEPGGGRRKKGRQLMRVATFIFV
jgi:hypothetical protein